MIRPIKISSCCDILGVLFGNIFFTFRIIIRNKPRRTIILDRAIQRTGRKICPRVPSFPNKPYTTVGYPCNPWDLDSPLANLPRTHTHTRIHACDSDVSPWVPWRRFSRDEKVQVLSQRDRSSGRWCFFSHVKKENRAFVSRDLVIYRPFLIIHSISWLLLVSISYR